MNKELEQFSVTLSKKHFDAAIQVREELVADGFSDVPFKIHTNDIYKKSFTFPQIAHNDYAVDQFESLAIAEQNLNNDPNSDNQFDQFLKSADEVAANLKDRYKDQWVDPKDDRASSSEWRVQKTLRWIKMWNEKTNCILRDKDRINNMKSNR